MREKVEKTLYPLSELCGYFTAKIHKGKESS